MFVPPITPSFIMSEEFRGFTKLPAEIRNMIWEYSLPEPRVYEVLDAPNAKQKTPAKKGLMFANIHPEPPPALASVCRESRFFVLHNYKPLTLGSTTKFVDLSRDILLLEPYLLVKRLHRALHFMSQIPLVRDNINRLALGTSYGMYTGICHPMLSWKVSKNNMGKLLQRLADFPKLRTLIFVVHQEFQFEFDFRCLPSHAIAIPPTAPTLMPRPQLVHQAYRFKFDIEANINYRPRRPHVNELLYYPLDIDEDKDDWDRDNPDEDSEFYDPWPTNDDWRRFRRRFQRAIHTSLDMGLAEGGVKPDAVPALKGASLLWRYTRGGYV